MSDLAFVNDETHSDGAHDCSDVPVVERTQWRVAEIAPGVTVERALPLRKRRTVGAWCFLDLAGPFDPAHGVPIDIGPHPHIGLQTVTWLFDGEVMHRDSVGSVQTIKPGELNLMNAGNGIVHSEHSPADVNGTGVHLAQLWIALPETARHGAPSFEHHEHLPIVEIGDGVRAQVLIGEHAGVRSPATAHTPIVGLDVVAEPGSAASLPLDPEFEYAAIVVSGEVTIAGEAMHRGELLYLGRRRSELVTASDTGARWMLLGGEPFESEIVMWWNFVGRSREEITEARSQWMRAAGFDDSGVARGDSVRFPVIAGDPSPSIPAPDLPWA